MKNLFLPLAVALAALTAGTAAAQPRPYQSEPVSGKQFYVELGGPGVLFSATFDSRFTQGTPLGFGYRVGLGFGVKSEEFQAPGGSWYDSRTRTYATIPVGLNYVFGKRHSPHAFEVGAGATILTRAVNLYTYDWNDETEGNMIGHFSFMYRRIPAGGGFTWRIGFTPVIGTGGDIFPTGTVGLGYSF